MNAVTLSGSETMSGALVGIMRRVDSMKRQEAHGHVDGDGWEIDCEGACAELAVAKYVGGYPSGSIRSWKDPDVVVPGGLGIHVRHTVLDDGCLIVRPADLEEGISGLFVLAVGRAPTFKIAGCFPVEEARSLPADCPWRRAPNDRPAALFIPQSSLQPVRPVRPEGSFPERIP